MHNEVQRQRLIEKYNLLDTPNEIKFDKLTEELAKEIGCYGATIAIVSTKRVWFKSRYGFLTDEVNVSCSLSRKLVFSKRDLLCIEQFSTDPKYKDHYNHTILGFDFFAAVPIELDNGFRIGALCIFDFHPRKLTPDQISSLKKKANYIAGLFKSCKNQFFNLESTNQSQENNIVKKNSSLGDFGGFYADTVTNELKWNPINNRLLNLKPDWTPQFNDLLNPDFSTHFRANNDVFRLIKELQTLIQNPDATQYSHLYTLNFGLPRPVYINMIYHRSGNNIHVVFKNESRLLDHVQKNSLKKSLLYEVESISKIGGWEYLVSTQELHFSRNASHILGTSTFTGASPAFLRENLRFKDLDKLEKGFVEAFKNGNEYLGIHEYSAENMPVKTIRIKGKPIYNKLKLIRVVGTIQDITEDKTPLDLLSRINPDNKTQVGFYKALKNNNTIFILQLAEDGSLVFSNSAYNTVFVGKKNSAHLIGKNELLSYSEKNQTKFREVIAQCLAEPGNSFPLLTERKDAFGRNSITAWDCCSIGNQSGTMQEILFIGIDTTQLEKNKKYLLKLVDKVSLQNERAIEFGHIINHHVGSQVANLEGLIQLMELINSPEEKMEYFSHLRTTVVNLLEITRIVSTVLHLQNHTQVERTTVEVEKLLDQVISEFWHELLVNPISIDLKIPKNLQILTVTPYLESVLKELITNSIQFRKPDQELKITISAHRHESSTKLIIRDNGIGIDLDLHKDRMFKLFNTLDPYSTRKGAGLYMTRVRVTALGGTIKVKSTPNKGTSFSIELPDEIS